VKSRRNTQRRAEFKLPTMPTDRQTDRQTRSVIFYPQTISSHHSQTIFSNTTEVSSTAQKHSYTGYTLSHSTKRTLSYNAKIIYTHMLAIPCNLHQTHIQDRPPHIQPHPLNFHSKLTAQHSKHRAPIYVSHRNLRTMRKDIGAISTFFFFFFLNN
jgi:hypothetical protein